jgi:hypothetical protein
MDGGKIYCRVAVRGVLTVALLVVATNAVGVGIPRSNSARLAFLKLQPCPATGLPKGPCPGYVIDHIKALACGGPDKPENMQWQTVAEAKEKDRWERIGCRKTTAAR